MPVRPITRAAAAVALLSAVAACSFGSGPGGGRKPSGQTYRQAMDAMYPDALAATKAAVPDIEPEEVPGGHSDCGGLDVLDSKDASKVRASAAVVVPLPATDHRSSKVLAQAVATQLVKRGWQRDKDSGDTPPGPDDDTVKIDLKKPGVHGHIAITATARPEDENDPSKGKWHEVTTDALTDCLRNPDWKG